MSMIEISQIPIIGSVRSIRDLAMKILKMAEQLEANSSSDESLILDDHSRSCEKKRHQSNSYRDRVFSKIAFTEYKLRRKRDEIFPSGLFADPAWDILLDLYVQYNDGRPVSVTSSCIASQVPPTTGLRWLGELEELGLVVREAAPSDKRVNFVSLTPKGLNLMREYLAMREKLQG